MENPKPITDKQKSYLVHLLREEGSDPVGLEKMSLEEARQAIYECLKRNGTLDARKASKKRPKPKPTSKTARSKKKPKQTNHRDHNLALFIKHELLDMASPKDCTDEELDIISSNLHGAMDIIIMAISNEVREIHKGNKEIVPGEVNEISTKRLARLESRLSFFISIKVHGIKRKNIAGIHKRLAKYLRELLGEGVCLADPSLKEKMFKMNVQYLIIK